MLLGTCPNPVDFSLVFSRSCAVSGLTAVLQTMFMKHLVTDQACAHMTSSSRSGVGGPQDQANPDAGAELDIEVAEGVVLPPVSRPRDKST